MAKKKSFVSKLVTALLVIFFLLLLTVGGAAAAIYSQLVNEEQIQWANETAGLYKLPLVGAGEMFEYFTVPEGVVWPEPEEEPEDNGDDANKNSPKLAAGSPQSSGAATPQPEPKKSKDVKISRKEIEAKMQEREAAEKKRISKLARIYDNMKPEEAAEALDGVDLDTVVLILQKMNESNAAQVLAKMEPLQAAQVTQMLFEGTQRRLPPLPAEQE